MKFRNIILTGLMTLSAVSYGQTTLTQTWKVNFGDRTFHSVMDVTRGMDYNPVTGNLLVNNRSVISRMDADDGTTVTPELPVTNYSGGNFLINKVACTSDGVIYVCNLATSAGGNFKIYRHADEESVATVAYAGTSAERMGDEIAVIGTGTSTKILVGGQSTTKVHIFTTADGLNFTINSVTPANPALSGTMPSLAWDPNGTDYWFRNTEADGAHKYSGSTHQGIGNYVGDPLELRYGPIGIAALGSLQLLGVGISNSAAGSPGKAVEFFDAVTNEKKYLAFNSEYPGGAKANGNGVGDVVFDIPHNRVFVLYTNNSITSYALPPASIDQWNKFD